MELKSEAHHSRVLTEGHNSNMTGRYWRIEGLVDRSDGISASVEDLCHKNVMSAPMIRRQSFIDYMSTMGHGRSSIIWKITALL